MQVTILRFSNKVLHNLNITEKHLTQMTITITIVLNYTIYTYSQGHLVYHFMANRWGKYGNSGKFYFLGLQNHCRQWLQPWNLRILAPWKKSYDKPSQCIKKWRYNCKYTKSHRKRETASRGSEPWVFIGFDVSSGKRWGMDQPLKQGLSASFTALLEEFAESSPVWSLWSITVFLYSGKIHAPLINMEFC